MSKKNKDKRQLTRWQVLGTGVSAGLIAFGGGTGISAIIDAVQGPDIAPQACDVYWDEIHQLKLDGFTGFELMADDAEIADRCGAPEDVASAWDGDTAEP